jgi:hypothetical protein
MCSPLGAFGVAGDRCRSAPAQAQHVLTGSGRFSDPGAAAHDLTAGPVDLQSRSMIGQLLRVEARFALG